MTRGIQNLKTPALLLALSLALIFPSLSTARKFLGTGSWIYFLGVPVVVFSLFHWFESRSLGHLATKKAILIFFLTVVLLAVLFAAVYPIVDSGFYNGGSDRDDDLNIAAGRMIRLQYPYGERTYLDNPINSFPGSILLSVPFWLLGNVAYQNLFWLAILFFVYYRVFGSGRAALFAWMAPLTCLEVLREFLTGGSLLTNSVQVVIFITLFYRSAVRPEKPLILVLFFAALLGIGLSSRINFLLILPVLASHLIQKRGFRPAALLLSVTIASYLLVTLPFICYDPVGFSPFENINRFSIVDAVFPKLSIILPALSLFCTLAAAFVPLWRRGFVGLLYGCAFVQLGPVALLVLTPIFFRHPPLVNASAYGLLFLFFLVPALCHEIFRPVS